MEAFDELTLEELLGRWRLLNWSGSMNWEFVFDDTDELDVCWM